MKIKKQEKSQSQKNNRNNRRTTTISKLQNGRKILSSLPIGMIIDYSNPSMLTGGALKLNINKTKEGLMTFSSAYSENFKFKRTFWLLSISTISNEPIFLATCKDNCKPLFDHVFSIFWILFFANIMFLGMRISF